MRKLPIQGPEREEIVATLRASSWFRALQQRAESSPYGAARMEQVIASADLVEAEPGETIVEEGFPSDGFFVLMRGSVQVKAGRQARVGRLRPPSSFGEVGLLLDEPRTATVIAEDAVRALRFSAQAFHEVFEKIPEFGLDTSRYLARRLREVTDLLQAATPAAAAERSPDEPASEESVPGATGAPEPVASNQPLIPAGEDDLLV